MITSSKIRLIKEEDCAAILDIYGPFISNTTITFEYVVPTLHEFTQRIRNISVQYPWLVCEIKDQVVGYAYASRHRERAAYQWSVDVSVYIKADYHRKHIAKALYTALIKILKLQGYINAYAGITVPNEKSKYFHEGFGFKSVGIYHNEGYKHGAWHNVEWLEYAISEHSLEPASPKPISQVCEIKEFNDILDSAMKLISIS